MAIALLANSLATGAALLTLIFTFASISGAHFNPAVTLAARFERAIGWREVLAFIPAQLGGGMAGCAISVAGDRYESLSAGTEVTRVHPLAIVAMREIGIDISAQRSKSIDEFTARPPQLVITVCDDAKEACPYLPAVRSACIGPFPTRVPPQVLTKSGCNGSATSATRSDVASKPSWVRPSHRSANSVT